MSLIFLIWFLSGFLMIYSGFPRADKKKTFEKQETLNKYATQIKTLAIDSVTPEQLTLSVLHKKPVYLYSNTIIDATTLTPITSFTNKALDSLIINDYNTTIKDKKIITDFDSWIPWSRYQKYFPIHKYYLADNTKTEVYLSEKTGTVVQETTSKTRWFARFGAIPHWFYYKSLRLNQGLWADFVIWLSGIGCIMCLSGLVVGIYRSRKWRKAKKKGLLGFSPYKEKWYRWHHIVGMTFGVFAFTFVFSGMISLLDVPQWQWIISSKTETNYPELWKEQANDINQFTLSIETLLNNPNFPNIKSVQYQKFNNTPYYVIQQEYGKPIWIDASKPEPTQKIFTTKEIEDIATQKFDKLNYKTTIMTESDGYYRGSTETVKFVFDDVDNSWFYVPLADPNSVRLLNKNERLGRWLYQGLHTFNFPVFEGIDWLRKTLLIIVSIFGTIISLTGVILGYRYFKRKIKKLHK